jgi:cysteinyl-tRNA synthetase
LDFLITVFTNEYIQGAYMRFVKILGWLILSLVLLACSLFIPVQKEHRVDGFANVKTWFYYLGSLADYATVEQLAASEYDMLVLDYVPSVTGDEDYPMADVINTLHGSDKLVLAYLSIGNAEEYRTYWQSDWEIGNPEWIIAPDPGGWEGNYLVSYWNPGWQALWLGEGTFLKRGGLLEDVLDAGFDGVYLDWVEAYSDDGVLAAADRDTVDAVDEMITWVGQISKLVKQKCRDCVVVAQNAADLVEDDRYVKYIDALAQEHIWFDGGSDSGLGSDCPLPHTDADINSKEYYDSLSPICQSQFDDDPDGTLHYSSEEVLYYLNIARLRSLPVFTVDYALEPENMAWIYETSRELGFIPFVSNRELDMYFEPVP